jgi:hypothetical protein
MSLSLSASHPLSLSHSFSVSFPHFQNLSFSLCFHLTHVLSLTVLLLLLCIIFKLPWYNNTIKFSPTQVITFSISFDLLSIIHSNWCQPMLRNSEKKVFIQISNDFRRWVLTHILLSFHNHKHIHFHLACAINIPWL